MLHIIYLSVFFLLWEKFCLWCLLECSAKISCSREIRYPVSVCEILILIFAVWPWETMWWDTDRLESEALFLSCSFSSLISFCVLGRGEPAQLCEAAVPALSCSPVTAQFPFCLLGPALGSFQGTQGRQMLECRAKGSPVAACLPACRLVTTLEVSPSVSQPYFAWIGLALCRHKEFLLVTQL